MDSGEKVFLSVVISLLATIVLVCFLVFLDSVEERMTISNLVSKGHDPIDVVCAFELTKDRPSSACITRAIRDK